MSAAAEIRAKRIKYLSENLTGWNGSVAAMLLYNSRAAGSGQKQSFGCALKYKSRGSTLGKVPVPGSSRTQDQTSITVTCSTLVSPGPKMAMPILRSPLEMDTR